MPLSMRELDDMSRIEMTRVILEAGLAVDDLTLKSQLKERAAQAVELHQAWALVDEQMSTAGLKSIISNTEGCTYDGITEKSELRAQARDALRTCKRPLTTAARALEEHPSLPRAPAAPQQHVKIVIGSPAPAKESRVVEPVNMDGMAFDLAGLEGEAHGAGKDDDEPEQLSASEAADSEKAGEEQAGEARLVAR
eukprot:6722430-Prymnesium_polylepis.1